MITNYLKGFLAILLFLCLIDWPYGYYQFVRIATTIGFMYLAYEAYGSRKTMEVLLFIALAILFQPFSKIALGRVGWNIVDVIVGIGLFISIFSNTREENK